MLNASSITNCLECAQLYFRYGQTEPLNVFYLAKMMRDEDRQYKNERKIQRDFVNVIIKYR